MNILEEIMRESGKETAYLFSEKSREQIEKMRSCFLKNGGRNTCFANIEYYENQICVDIYVWSLALPSLYKRFVISPNAIMTWKERIWFDIYCRDKEMKVSQDEIQKIFVEYSNNKPEIHLCPYSNPMQMLHHIYCTLHTGLEEILYKANLGYLALYLDEMDDCNLIETTPSGIFDGLPIKLLRLFNTEYGIDVLKTTKSRNLIYELFIKRQNLFQRKWSYGQCKYFAEIICKRDEEGFIQEDYWILSYLSEYRTEEAHFYYMDYLKKRHELQNIVSLPLWPDKNEDYTFEKAEYLYKILCEKGEQMNALYALQEEDGKEFEYCDDQYAIIWPRNLEDLAVEAQNQKNCLWNFLEDAATGVTYYLFMRKVENLESSYITVEIQDDEIFQALGKFNRRLTKEEREWLLAYADRMLLRVHEEVLEDV